MKLYMAIIKGKEAEVHARLDISPRRFRNLRDEALSGLCIAMEYLQQAGRGLENIDWSKTWAQRLQIAPNSIDLHSASIPSLPEYDHYNNRFEIHCCGSFGTKVYSGFISGAFTGVIDPNSVLGEAGGCPSC